MSDATYETILLRGRRRRPRRHHHAEPARGAQRVRPPDVRGDARRVAAWSRTTPTVNAVVLRAAGDRAFCAGLDTKKPLRPARRRLEPRGPGRAAEPEVAEGVEAGGVRGAGHLHRRRVLLRQRGRRRDLLRRRDVLRLPRHLRHGVRARAGRADAPHRPRRDAAHGADRATTSGSRAETALRIGLVTEVVERDELWARAHEIAAGIARQAQRPPPRAPCGRSGSRSTAVPRRDGAGPDLHPPRQPDRHGRGRARPPIARAADAEDAGDRAARRAAHRRRCSRSTRRRRRSSSSGAWRTWGELGADRRRGRRRAASARRRRAGRRPAAQPARATSALLLGVLRAGGVRGHDQPAARRRAASAPTSPSLDLAAARRRRPTTSPLVAGDELRATTRRALGDARRADRRSTAPDRRDRRRDRARRRGARCSPAAPPGRRSGSTSPTRCSSGCSSGPSTTRRTATPTLRLRTGVAIVNAPLVHLGGLFRVLQCVNDGRSFALLERFTVDGWVDAVRRHRPATVEPRAGRAADGARRRPRPRRPRAASGRSISGTAPLDPDDADAFTDAVRRARAHLVRRHRVRRRRGRLEPRRPRAVLGDEAGERRPGPRRAASCASSTRRRARRSAPTRRACSRCKAGQLGDGAAGCAPPTSPASTPTASSGSSAAPTRPSSAAGSRCSPTTCGPRSSATRRCAGAAVVGRDDRRLGAVPVAAVELRAGAGAVTRRRPRSTYAADRARPLRAARPRSGSSTSCPAPTPARSTSPPCARCSSTRRRAELTWTCATPTPTRPSAPRSAPGSTTRCPSTARRPRPATGRRAGPTTPAGSASCTTPATPGCNWPVEFGGRGLPVTQQLVYLEEYAASGAPYIGVNFVGICHAGPTLIAEGTDEQRALPPPADPRGRDVWCQGFSEPEAGSDLASLRTRAVRDGDDYVVTGQKIWSTRAHVADYCELLVRTDPDAPEAQGHHLADPRHAPARRRGAPDADHRRREPLLRGVPRRRAGAGRRTGSARRTTAGGSPT